MPGLLAELRTPPAAPSRPFHLDLLRVEQPRLKMQRLHLQNQPMSGLRASINYPGVSNTRLSNPFIINILNTRGGSLLEARLRVHDFPITATLSVGSPAT